MVCQQALSDFRINAMQRWNIPCLWWDIIYFCCFNISETLFHYPGYLWLLTLNGKWFGTLCKHSLQALLAGLYICFSLVGRKGKSFPTGKRGNFTSFTLISTVPWNITCGHLFGDLRLRLSITLSLRSPVSLSGLFIF